jgi:hypothetical protein
MRLRALPLLGLLLFPGTASAQAPCARAGYREVASNNQAAVLARRGQPGVKAACLFTDGRLRYLANTQDDWVSHVTLTGHFVAYYDHYVDGAPTGTESGFFRVLDIERRKGVFADRTTLYSNLEDDYAPQRGLPVVIRLKRNGSVAWSTCPWHRSGGEFGEPLRCNRPGPRSQYQVVAHSSAERTHSRGRILDEGPTVGPRSLRLDGSSLTWTDGDGEQQAQLP